MEPIDLSRKIVALLEGKLAEDIVLLEIGEICDFTDYFIIASGTSDRMLDSLAKNVLEKIKQDSFISARQEGNPESGWIVLDYGSVVVHLLTPVMREFYDLEDLWKKGKIILHFQ